MIQATTEQLAAAFTEWERRYREEPERFESEARRLLYSDAETYGGRAAPYLEAILAEQASGRPDPGVADVRGPS